MFEINIYTQSGTMVDRIPYSGNECTIGKDDSCFVQLKGWKIGRSHAFLYVKDGGVYIKASKHPLGTLVNGEKVSDYGPLQPDDEIAIHAYRLKIREYQSKKMQATLPDDDFIEPKPVSTPQQSVSNEVSAPAVPIKAVAEVVPEKNVEPAVPAVDEEMLTWQRKLHEDLIRQMDLRRINVSEMSDEELRGSTGKLLDDILDKAKGFPASIDKSVIHKRVLDEAVGLGPLEELIAREDVSEIMVNSSSEIFYETNGQLLKSDITFSNDRAVIYAIERIVTPLGRRIDESSPMVDARLKDGSRVNAIIPPLALKGPCITIRKFMKERLQVHHLVKFGSATDELMDFLQKIVKHKQNVIISGGTGSGKTTLLNVLSNSIPDNERIITVEDAAELRLNQPHIVSLEARPSNQEGRGAVHIRDLVKNCLRMRPDRIVVGECRGGEALDMLQAMNTGHEGSLTTAHANTPRDCISRIEVMVMMAGMDLPTQAIREQISSAIDFIVQQTRFSCGTRKITSVCEVGGIEGSRIQMGEIFKFVQTGYNDKGKVDGYFTATGQVPKFYEDLKNRGIPMDLSIFDEDRVA